MVAGADRIRREQLFPDPARCAAGADGAGQATVGVAVRGDLHGGERCRRRAGLSDRVRGVRSGGEADPGPVYGYGTAYAAFQAKFQEYGLWIILIKGLTPIPYKIVTIAAGAARFDFGLFMMASVLTRGARFFLVATLLHFFGDRVRDFIETRLTLVTSALAVGVLGGFLALKFL